ncbi:MAG: fasciclin domain-containing protein [Flavobacteriales bacterium]|nr:fasciclin domain-containing protein [Flavobacteriales bacterium]
MKQLLVIGLGGLMWTACGQPQGDSASEVADAADAPGQSAVQDEYSRPNVVQVAVSSADHSTLVTAVTTAGLVDVLSNVGPFTVFAPVNDAFAALPAGTVESLLKPENKAQLTDILEYHVYVGVIRTNLMRDGMTLNQVNSKNVTITKDGDRFKVNNANIIASIDAANGVIHVIDAVLLPQ